MRKSFQALIFGAWTFVGLLHAEAATLNLDKFKIKAQQKCEKLMGSGNLKGKGSIYFRDGAGATDLEPLFDYASFIYVVDLKPGILPASHLRLGYRLNLNGSEGFVLLNNPSKFKELGISMPGEGIVTLNPDSSPASVKDLIDRLTRLWPKGEFTYLSEIGVLTFSVSVNDTKGILKELRQSPLVADLALNEENYRLPFVFGNPVLVRGKGKIDPDQYRTVTRELKEQGLRFATETTVPRELE